MIYEEPGADLSLSQGDIIDDCPIVFWEVAGGPDDLHTIPRFMLERLIHEGKRRCRLQTPYREHLSQHFSTTYGRIGLPEPYETQPES
jgi:hypothetical protein